MKTSGIIGIQFNDDVSEDVVKKTIEKIYLDNKSVISGMKYLEFVDEPTFKSALADVESYK